MFLPDFDKTQKKEKSPEQQILISSTFNLLSGIISLILTIWLHILYTGKEGTPVIIYIVSGFLTANFFWQIQAFWRIQKIKKDLPQRKVEDDDNNNARLKIKNAFSTDKLLSEADSSEIIMPSFLKDSAKGLNQKIKSS